MRFAIIGAGHVGGALGPLLVERGHEVVYAARDPAGLRAVAAVERTPGASAVPVAAAVEGSDAVILAVPWDAVEDALRQVADWSGRLLIDATNRLGPAPDGEAPSGAEVIAALAPSARIVKAFNAIGANRYARPSFAGEASTMLICGDDAAAKAQVAALVGDLGFEVVDAGPLASARLLEAMAELWVVLAMREGLGIDIGFRLLTD
jgi:predicted dinucleotide-binding enzyme